MFERNHKNKRIAKDTIIPLPGKKVKVPDLSVRIDMIQKARRARRTVHLRDVLKKMFIDKDKSTIRKMEKTIQKNPNVTSEIAKRATQSDFRNFIKDMLDGQQNNICETLEQLKEISPKDYQSVVLSWAKFAHPNTDNVKVDIEMSQKRDIMAKIKEQYAYSEQAEIKETAQIQPNPEIRMLTGAEPEKITEEELPSQQPMSIEEIQEFTGGYAGAQSSFTDPYPDDEDLYIDEDVEQEEE